MEIKKNYHSPIVETEVVFNAEAGEIALFTGRCWGLTEPWIDSNGNPQYFSNGDGSCKNA